MGVWGWVWWGTSRSQLVKTKQKRPFTYVDDVCICTTEPRPRVLHGPNGSRSGDELLDLLSTCHDGAYRGQGQLLGPSNPRLESLMGFKRRGSLCTWSTWHPREAEKGSCASGRFRRHLDGFRRFAVHLNHKMKCEAKLRPWCTIYLM